MAGPDHARLLGRYATPTFRYGDAAVCEVRGEGVVPGLSAALISWPVGKRPGCRARALVVSGGPADAVRVESAAAACHGWGVTAQTVLVRAGRRALGRV